MGFTLNGDADYLDVGTMGTFGSSLSAKTLVFSAWVKSSNTSSIMHLFGVFNDGTTTGIQLGINSTLTETVGAGQIRFFKRDGDGSAQDRVGHINTDTGITNGSWHHILFISQKGDEFLYIDNSEVTLTSPVAQDGICDNMADWGYNFTIGARNVRGTVGGFWTGSITEVYMWAIADDSNLTQTERDLIYLSGLKRIGLQIQPSNLTGGYWPLDDVSEGVTIGGKKFIDLSGSGNTGTGVDADGDSVGLSEFLSYPDFARSVGISGAVAPPAATTGIMTTRTGWWGDL